MKKEGKKERMKEGERKHNITLPFKVHAGIYKCSTLVLNAVRNLLVILKIKVL